MKQKSVLALGVVTGVALVVALLALRDGGASASGSARARLFPELSARINDVAEVRVEKAGMSSTLRREGGQWTLSDRGGYPAKFEKVKELAVRLADLEIEETLTARKENHAKLAVEWPTSAPEGSEAGEAGLITLKDAGGKELAALVVGKSEWQGSKPKIFVRRAGEDQVYRVAPRGSLDVVPTASNWIDSKLVELANERVQAVTIEHADGEKVEIARSAANHTQFTVQNVPPGEAERFEGVANGVAQALSTVQLEDVRPVTEIDFAAQPVAKTRFRCVDGLELVVETAKFEDKTWIKIAASYSAPPEAPAPAVPEGEAPAEAPAAEPKKDVAKEAQELSTRLAPWAFAVGSYKTDVLARRMKDLLAVPPEPGAEEAGLEGVLQDMDFEMPQDGDLTIEPDATPDDEEVPAPDPHDHDGDGAADHDPHE